MQKLVVLKKQFNLKKFFKTIEDYWRDNGTTPDVSPFPIVQDGIARFDASEMDAEDEDYDEEDGEEDVEEPEISNDPAELLERGYTLFATFTQWLDFDCIACADGTEIEVPDEDELNEDEEEDEDGEATEKPKVDDRMREMLAKTYTDECSCYGFLVEPNGANLIIQTAVLRDVTGDCDVEVVEDAGLFEEAMSQFIQSLIRKPRPKLPPQE